MKTARSWVFMGSLLGLASLASAATAPFVGTLAATDPVFNRPLVGNPPPGLSGVGTAVSFDVFPFFVTAADTYSLATLSANLLPVPADDTFMVLYQTSFSATAPLTNVLQADDDAGPGGLSLITRALVPGTQYVMVVTTFSNSTFGDYTGSISNAGAGTAVFGLVPEPSTALMMLGALAAGGLVAARRRQA